MDRSLVMTANNIWKRAASQATPEQLSFEVEVYKTFLTLFHVGSYFYSIFNYARNDFDMVDSQLESVLGYSTAGYDIPFLMNAIHPGDLPYFLNFENKAIDFLTTLSIEDLVNYKILHDYRVKKADGNYIRLLQQGIVIEHDETGGILRTLIVHTDITHLKPQGKPLLSFIGIAGRKSYVDVKAETIIIINNEILSTREKEILRLIIRGHRSKEIASILYISKQTVDKHRKNMLSKTSLSNTAELIAKAIQNGWL